MTEKDELIKEIVDKVLSDPFGVVDRLITQILDLQRSNEELARIALQRGAAKLPDLDEGPVGVI